MSQDEARSCKILQDEERSCLKMSLLSDLARSCKMKQDEARRGLILLHLEER